MPDIEALDRLKSQLLTSGLQERNNALWQVINQLIDFLRRNIDTVTAQTGSSGGGGGSGLVNASYITVLPEGGLPNSRQLVAGAGINIQLTPNGRIVIHSAVPLGGGDGGDGEEGPPGPPGPAGIKGADGTPGAQGNSGPPGFGYDGEDGLDGFPYPGIAGPAGGTGNTGAKGDQGPPGMDGVNFDDIETVMPLGNVLGNMAITSAESYSKIFMLM